MHFSNAAELLLGLHGDRLDQVAPYCSKYPTWKIASAPTTEPFFSIMPRSSFGFRRSLMP